MSDIFHEVRLQRIDDINKQYAMLSSNLDDRRRAKIDALYQEMEIKRFGWEAFEKGESLHKNPYKFSGEPEKSNYWKAGWEMASLEKDIVQFDQSTLRRKNETK